LPNPPRADKRDTLYLTPFSRRREPA